MEVSAKGHDFWKSAMYGRHSTGPPGCPCPNPRTCEHVTFQDKRDFAEVIKLRLFRWKIILDSLGGPKAVTRVLINERERQEGQFELWHPELQIVNLCCFKELMLWQFVTAAVGNHHSCPVTCLLSFLYEPAGLLTGAEMPVNPLLPAHYSSTLWGEEMGPWEDLKFSGCERF